MRWTGTPPTTLFLPMPTYEYRCTERTHLRGDPEHVRRSRRDLRGLRRRRRAGLPSGRGPLQGLGLLHDRLREEGEGRAAARTGTCPTTPSSSSGTPKSGSSRATRSRRQGQRQGRLELQFRLSVRGCWLGRALGVVRRVAPGQLLDRVHALALRDLKAAARP